MGEVRWYHRRLPFDDEHSRLYLHPHFRSAWVVVFLTGAAVIKVWGMVPESIDRTATAEAIGIISITPTFLSSLLRLIWPGERRLRSLGPTKPGKEGPEPITVILRSIHDLIAAHAGDGDAKLRVTLFVPDTPARVLRQFARFSTASTRVSKTVVRMGTGDVGRAFTWNKTIHVHDVDTVGGFDGCMRSLGLEPEEIDTHADKARRTFVAIPLVDSDARKRFGVLSLDAAVPEFFAKHADDLNRAKRLLLGLLAQLSEAGIQGVPLQPNAPASSEQGHRDDSDPFLRIPGESGQLPAKK